MSFDKSSVESRRADCARLLAANPGAVPIVAQIAKSKGAKPVLIALPRSATVADLVAQLNGARETTLLVEDCAPAATTVLGDLFDCCRADDGFLHVAMVSEVSLGNTVGMGLPSWMTCGGS